MSCIYRASGLFNMMVHHCNVISKSFKQQKDGGFSKIMTYRVAHIEKECMVVCFSGQQRVMRKILVIGM